MGFHSNVSAVVLAAGLSSRMGRFKLVLPWGDGAVIEQVVSTIQAAGVPDIIVVLGHRAAEVRAVLAGHPVRCVVNEQYTDGSMLTSIRAGLEAAPGSCPAALLCLGDQPQMLASSVQAVLAEGERTRWQDIIIPSYQMHAGHPILLPHTIWPAVMASTGTLRDILREDRAAVRYLVLDTQTILADLDTPEDYARAREEQERGEA